MSSTLTPRTEDKVHHQQQWVAGRVERVIFHYIRRVCWMISERRVTRELLGEALNWITQFRTQMRATRQLGIRTFAKEKLPAGIDEPTRAKAAA